MESTAAKMRMLLCTILVVTQPGTSPASASSSAKCDAEVPTQDDCCNCCKSVKLQLERAWDRPQAEPAYITTNSRTPSKEEPEAVEVAVSKVLTGKHEDPSSIPDTQLKVRCSSAFCNPSTSRTGGSLWLAGQTA